MQEKTDQRGERNSGNRFQIQLQKGGTSGVWHMLAGSDNVYLTSSNQILFNKQN